MIINIAGTSGSGKSSAMRKILQQIEPLRPYFFDHDQDKVAGYVGVFSNKRVVVIGSYGNPTGGCDTLPNLEMVFKDVEEFARRGVCVLFEGLLVSRSKGRLLQLFRRLSHIPMFIYHLTTPLDLCIESIDYRRQERGKPPLEDHFRTKETFRRITKITHDLGNLGIPVFYVDRNNIVDNVLEKLNGSI